MTSNGSRARPDLTLICSTLGPASRLKPLLESLERSSANVAVELLLVDQSDDGAVAGEVGSAPRSFEWEVLTSARGLSRGRNAALGRARGRVVGFPDDDVWYPDGLLERVLARFDEPTLDGVLVRQGGSVDGTPRALRYPVEACTVTRRNAILTGISSGIFLRRRVVQLVGRFAPDVGAGAGSPWGAGEETDYLIRAVDLGARLEFDPGCWVVHPLEETRGDVEVDKHRRYGRGIGHVFRRRGYPVTYPAWLITRRMAKTGLLGARGRWHEARVGAMWAIGIAEGYGGRFAEHQRPLETDSPADDAAHA